MKKVNWTVSGGLIYNKELIDFNGMLRTFYASNFNFIDTVFDGSYGLAWASGRIGTPRNYLSVQEIEERIYALNLEGIGFNFTFSQKYIDEKLLEDKACNALLDEISKCDMNGIIYTNDLLGDYVRDKYPTLKLTYSAHNNIQTANDFDKALLKNDLVVLNQDWNKDYDFLKTLNNKDKIEIIVNEPCFTKCPYKQEHINRIWDYNLSHANTINFFDKPLDAFDLCLARANGMSNELPTNWIPSKDIPIYRDMGFKWFKLIGREYEWDRLRGDLKAYLEESWIREVVKEYEH